MIDAPRTAKHSTERSGLFLCINCVVVQSCVDVASLCALAGPFCPGKTRALFVLWCLQQLNVGGRIARGRGDLSAEYGV